MNVRCSACFLMCLSDSYKRIQYVSSIHHQILDYNALTCSKLTLRKENCSLHISHLRSCWSLIDENVPSCAVISWWSKISVTSLNRMPHSLQKKDNRMSCIVKPTAKYFQLLEKQGNLNPYLIFSCLKSKVKYYNLNPYLFSIPFILPTWWPCHPKLPQRAAQN